VSHYENGSGHDFAAVDDWRRYSVFPLVLDRLAALGAEARVFDYGGGDGRFAAMCAELPVAEAVTYDLSREMSRLAEATVGGAARVRVATEPSAERAESFDAVTCHAVWMCWSSEEECRDNLASIRRLLRDGGLFVASVTHPCFRDQRFSTYWTEFDLSRYLDDGSPFAAHIGDAASEVVVHDTHWSLGAMSAQLARSGFSLRALHEVPDAPDSAAKGSPWLIVEAIKT
jgi:SAM-dependent methyltransferase